MAFQDATAASVSYALLYRCGLSPEQFFEPDDFSHVYEFDDYESVLALDMAVNELSTMLLWVLERTIKQYERGKRAKRQQGIGDPPPEPAADVPDHTAQEEQQQDTATPKGPDEASSGPSAAPSPEQQEIMLPDPAPAPAGPIPASQPVPTGNFRITDDHLGEGGPKAKYQMNIAAIRTLRQIETEDHRATPEEQEVLSRYVGWGGIAKAFAPDDSKWAKEYAELKELLTPEEYSSARSTVLNAHYTNPVIIKAVYQSIADMEFKIGNILEPSCGVGNFFGCLPEAMAASKLYGVELDGITGRIAKQLYPEAYIQVTGFEAAKRQDFYDLAVSNVPFGRYQVNDPAYNKLGFSIHNYFFAKALSQLRPGGILAFITSRYTMDAEDATAREYLAERAVLLGAVRLPNNAFKANAGTDVVADVIFLQKREEPILDKPEWTRTAKTEDGFNVNQYFLQHPEMVLGIPTEESTQYGMDYTVAPIPGADLAQQLQAAIKDIHGEYQAAQPDEADEGDAASVIQADPDVKNFSFAIVNGSVYYRENSIMVRQKLNATAAKRVKGMVELRDCVHHLIDLQLRENVPDSALKNTQDKLNRLYDAYAHKFGLVSNRANRLAFGRDSAYYLLCSLEVLDDDGNLKRKADMFTKRTIKQHRSVTHVDTASEALVVSIGERARVDLRFMSQLADMPEDDLIHDLQGVIFKDPAMGDEPYSGWQTADEYLSGNVRKKLRVAQEAAERNPAYQRNVDALIKVIPKDLDASEIDVRLGTTWIDKSYIQQFMVETFRTPAKLDIQVNYSPHTAGWFISNKSSVSVKDVMAYNTYGTRYANAYQILESSLNLRDVRIYDTVKGADGKERRVLNVEATTLAAQKQQAIKDTFQSWIFRDPERRQTLVRLYNDIMNCIRPREYDGSHIVFSGINPKIELQPHQVNAIAHVLYGGNTLLAHEVGAGKTFEMVAAAMEAKRLGLCSKSIFVVPNHLTQQTASEFLRLYPAANLLVTTERDFEKSKRKKFCARIATGDYDAIIIGHSQFEKIPVSYERQKTHIEEQIFDITEGIREIKRAKGEYFNIKQMEELKKDLEASLERLQANYKKDSVVTFEQLGVDMMFVDESDNYRLEDNVRRYFPQQISETETRIAGIKADMETLARHPHPKDGFAGMTVLGEKYADRESAGAAILAACQGITDQDLVLVAKYRGFGRSVVNSWSRFIMTIKGNAAYQLELGEDARGNIARIDNGLKQLPDILSTNETHLADLNQQLAAAKTELGKPFAQEDELKAKSARLAALDAQLNLGGKASGGQAAA